MVKSSPTSTFVVAQAEFLLEILVVALDAPAQMRGANQVIDCAVLGQRDSQYLVGSLWPAGHSMSSRSWGCSRALPELPPARLTRNAAKRLLSVSLVPSRQLIVWNVFESTALASALTFIG